MDIKQLMRTFPHKGKVEWISFRPISRGEVTEVNEIEITEEKGILGDHYTGKNRKRQVTLIQAEHLEAVAKLLGKTAIDPKIIRRNIVISGINLLAFNELQFKIGDVTLQMTGYCHPCTRMESNLGTGGYNAMRGHGGITAMVVKGGKIKVGDEVYFEA